MARGHIRQRGKGKWVVVYDLPRLADGKRRQKWVTVHGTKRDAQATLNRLLVEAGSIEGERVPEAKPMKMPEYFRYWLREYAEANVSTRTFERYEDLLLRYAAPTLGDKPVTTVTAMDIQRLYSHLRRAGGVDGRPLSARTVLHVHRVLSECLKHAVTWGLLPANPASGVRAPTPRPKEIRVIDDKDIATLIEKAEGTRVYVLLVLAVATGCRRQELLAFKWSDWDEECGVLTVHRALEQTKKYGVRFKEPKSLRGRRAILLPRFAQDALQQHRAQQAAHIERTPDYQDNDLIVCRPDGKPWMPHTCGRVFIEFCERHGYQGLSLHRLRHGHASALLKAGVHPFTVASRLGQIPSLTLNTYSHLLPGLQEEAVARFETVVPTVTSTVVSGASGDQ